MKKKLPVYEINVIYPCIINDTKIMSLLSFINDENLNFLLKEKESIFYDENNRLRIVPNINDINEEIKNKLESMSIPNNLLFVYDKEDDNNPEYIYIKEVFSGTSIKVDKTLVSYFEMNRTKANVKLLGYNLDQIESIHEMMYDVKSKLKRQKIIDFPIKRIKER